MTPNELYISHYIRIETGIDVIRNLQGCYFNHVPEIDESTQYTEINLPRIQIRIHGFMRVDFRRFYVLSSVWFDETPVMVIQNAGREGDDHVKRWVTDRETYFDMVAYIQSLLPITERTDEFVSPTKDIGDVQSFYGDCLKIGEETKRICC